MNNGWRYISTIGMTDHNLNRNRTQSQIERRLFYCSEVDVNRNCRRIHFASDICEREHKVRLSNGQIIPGRNLHTIWGGQGMEKKAPLEDPLPNGFETRTACEIISVTSKLHLRHFWYTHNHDVHIWQIPLVKRMAGHAYPHRNFICFVHRIEDYGSKGKHQNQGDKQ